MEAVPVVGRIRDAPLTSAAGAALLGPVMTWIAMTKLLAAADAGGMDPLNGLGMPTDAGGLFNFEPYNLLAGLVFGTIGWGAFIYGRKLELWQPRAIGLGLMIYPYFISNGWILWGIGIGLLVLLWFYHDE